MEKFLTLLILVTALFACSKQQSRLEQTLQFAGENRVELEKVLQHYANDSLKLKAAGFLIENMYGHFSIRSGLIEQLSTFYRKHREISVADNWQNSTKWSHAIDSLRDRYRHTFPVLSESVFDYDIQSITAEWLISQIDLAFDGWRENAYFKDCSWNTFAEYILPYRAGQTLVLDNSRDTFFTRHQDFFASDSIYWQDKINEILYQYKGIIHSNFAGMDIPIYAVSTLEYIQRGLCEHRCWFNVQLLRSSGIPVAIDFVPHWGNRNLGHTWNVIVTDSASYPFESYWEADNWKYNWLYNNCSFHKRWGRFRLPKVFRKTFSSHVEGPLADKNMPRHNIPPLFLNAHNMDVSVNYFDTTNLQLRIAQKSPVDRYAYLSVFGRQKWHPVQWGKIENGMVTFNGMGREIVYLPVFYENGQIVPAHTPVFVDKDGVANVLQADTAQRQRLALRNLNGTILGSDYNKKNLQNCTLLHHSIFTGGKKPDFSDQTFLCNIPDSMELFHSVIPVSVDGKYRYIRLHIPKDTIGLNELVFYTLSADGERKPIQNIVIQSVVKPVHPMDSVQFITDPYAATGCKGRVNHKRIDIDLGSEYPVCAIGYTPYLEPELITNEIFELFYWDNGWKSLGQQRGNKNCLYFDNVPTNALFLLKNRNWKDDSLERIFLYQRNEVCWM